MVTLVLSKYIKAETLLIIMKHRACFNAWEMCI